MKKLISLLLSICMVFTVLVGSVAAAPMDALENDSNILSQHTINLYAQQGTTKEQTITVYNDGITTIDVLTITDLGMSTNMFGRSATAKRATNTKTIQIHKVDSNVDAATIEVGCTFFYDNTAKTVTYNDEYFDVTEKNGYIWSNDGISSSTSSSKCTVRGTATCKGPNVAGTTRYAAYVSCTTSGKITKG